MKKFEYDIMFDEDEIPYVILSEEYEDTTEDKFMIMQLATALLETVYEKNKDAYDDPNIPKNILEDVIIFLSGISYEIGQLLKNETSIKSDIKTLLRGSEEKKEEKEFWDIKVDKIKDRNDLPKFNIIYNDEVFERKEGLRVFVRSTRKTYELVDGIENNNWEEIKKDKNEKK